MTSRMAKNFRSRERLSVWKRARSGRGVGIFERVERRCVFAAACRRALRGFATHHERGRTNSRHHDSVAQVLLQSALTRKEERR